MLSNRSLGSGFVCALFDSIGRFIRSVCSWCVTVVAIMKMISSVNPRSIRFVTFSSEIGCCEVLRRKVRAMVSVGSLRFQLDPIGERAREIFQLGHELLRFAEEKIVAEH